MKPSVGRIVHYVSYGTPGGEHKRECRAAIVTEVHVGGSSTIVPETISLAVLSPTGMFFNEDVVQDQGGGQPGDPECPHPHGGGPHRYCACGWTEPSHRGGTWHWPERI